MNVNALLPRNTQNARTVGVNAFKKFLVSECVSLEYVYECLANETSGSSFSAVMDKFAIYLAFNENAARKHLARNTVMSYFRQEKELALGYVSPVPRPH